MSDPSIFTLLIMGLFTNNFVLVKFLGICPFLGVSKKTETAFGMGMAVTFVMTIASLLTWLANEYILKLLQIEYLQTILFILIIATIVQLVEMFLQKMVPALYAALGIYLPLITTNCAVLGVALLNITNGYGLISSGVLRLLFGAGLYVGDRAVCRCARTACAFRHSRVFAGLSHFPDFRGADCNGLFGLFRHEPVEGVVSKWT